MFSRPSAPSSYLHSNDYTIPLKDNDEGINETHATSNKRILSLVRILDLGASPLARLPAIPFLAPEVVRLCEENRRWSAHAAPILVEKVSINKVPQLDGFDLPRIRSMGKTHTYILFLHDHHPLGFHRRLAILPRTWERRSLASLRNIVLILPRIPEPGQRNMEVVVQAVRICVERFFDVAPKTVRIELVGVERFGAEFFGVEEGGDVQEGVRATFGVGEHALKAGVYRRFRCLPWDRWRDAQAYEELKSPPPPIFH